MFDVDKDFEVNGNWWLPHNEINKTTKVFGVLSFNRITGINLILEGSLYGIISLDQTKHNFKIPIVIGETNTHYITLFNLSGSEFGSNWWIQSNFNVEYALSFNNLLLPLRVFKIEVISFPGNTL